MAKYITTAEASAFTGAPDNATLASVLLGAEALFDTLIGSETGILTSTKTEYHPAENKANNGRIFYLKTHKPTTITTVNGASPGTVDVDYTIEGQKLEFDEFISAPTAFPYRYKIVYVSGYTNIGAIPDDVKLAIKEITGAIWNSRSAQGMSSFKQDLLSVNYDKSVLDTLGTAEKSHLNTVINKYKVFSVI